MSNSNRLISRKFPTEKEIQARAYEIYLQRGCQPGHEVDDWLQAEYELIQLPVRKIAELPPPAPKQNGNRRKSLVTLVQAAVLFGAEALPYING